MITSLKRTEARIGYDCGRVAFQEYALTFRLGVFICLFEDFEQQAVAHFVLGY